MKPFISAVAVLSLGAVPLFAQSSSVYTNFIRQVQFPALEDGSYLEKDVSVESAGSQLSSWPITSGGARFELWALRTAHQSEYLLDSSFVGTYTPTATVSIVTEDPYTTIPRTRADKSFDVFVTVNGLLAGEGYPAAAKGVNFLHHVQSYGTDGTGENINKDNATLFDTVPISTNITTSTKQGTYVVHVPATDLTKARGEERFSIYSLDDYQVPASQLASKYVQIWPMAEGEISGIKDGDLVRFEVPQITVTFKDLYPGSKSYLQAYSGGWIPGKVGAVNLSSYTPNSDAVPLNKVLTIPSSSWNDILDKDGTWTIEMVTETPWGIEPVEKPGKSYVTVVVDRSIKVNSNISTSE